MHTKIIMVIPVTTSQGRIELKEIGSTVTDWDVLPIKGLEIRHAGRIWECQRVLLDASMRYVEAYVTPIGYDFGESLLQNYQRQAA